MLPTDQVAELLGGGSANAQVIVLDHMTRLSSAFGLVAAVKENVDQILFGGDLGTQRFVDIPSFSAKKEAPAKNVLHSFMDDELSQIVVPTANESEE